MVVTGGSGLGDAGQTLQASSCEMSKFWVCNIQHGNHS